MEDQIKKRAEELQQRFAGFAKQLQELIAAKTNIEQQITITKENMLQVKGAYTELTALLGNPELPKVATGKKKPTRTTVGKKKGEK